MGSEERVPEPSEIEQRVLGYLQRELLSPGATVGGDTELLSGAVLDSMSVLRLAAFVAQEFGIALQPSDFTIENFQSVSAIAQYVRRVRAARAPESSAR